MSLSKSRVASSFIFSVWTWGMSGVIWYTIWKTNWSLNCALFCRSTNNVGTLNYFKDFLASHLVVSFFLPIFTCFCMIAIYLHVCVHTGISRPHNTHTYMQVHTHIHTHANAHPRWHIHTNTWYIYKKKFYSAIL